LESECAINWEATARSVSLDRKLELEIGRYELRSSGLRDGFFKRAVTTACFCDVGRIPASSEALHIAAMTGANTLAARLMSQVGAGSSVQCLVGDFFKSLRASGAVIGWN